jgi:hypothetical protein
VLGDCQAKGVPDHRRAACVAAERVEGGRVEGEAVRWAGATGRSLCETMRGAGAAGREGAWAFSNVARRGAMTDSSAQSGQPTGPAAGAHALHPGALPQKSQGSQQSGGSLYHSP